MYYSSGATSMEGGFLPETNIQLKYRWCHLVGEVGRKKSFLKAALPYTVKMQSISMKVDFARDNVS